MLFRSYLASPLAFACVGSDFAVTCSKELALVLSLRLARRCRTGALACTVMFSGILAGRFALIQTETGVVLRQFAADQFLLAVGGGTVAGRGRGVISREDDIAIADSV